MFTAPEKIFGLFGDPVAHSVSPAMQQAAFAAAGLNYCYLSFNVKSENLAAAVAALRVLGLGGVNITIPHKERVIAYLDEVEHEAGLIGAVNTVVNREGRLVGYNTDVPGFLLSLRKEADFDLRGKRAVLLGAGGAGRAVAFGLAMGGVESLDIFNKSPHRAEMIAQEIHRYTMCEVGTGDLASERLPRVLERADLLVNATSVGMHPHLDDSPLPDPQVLNPGLLVYDLVYNPVRTRLLQEAEARGCRVLNGIGMLVYQGAMSFELWTGRKAAIDAMRAAVEEAL